MTELPFRAVENNTSAYLPLDTSCRQIRCVTVSPAAKETDPLICTLKYVSLEDTSRAGYEALSYCWGDVTDTVPISLQHPHPSSSQECEPRSADTKTTEQESSVEEELHVALCNLALTTKRTKQEFFVTRELDTALRNFRLQDQPRTLWIDAICINQNDDAERSHQVAFMSHVYSCAERVLVWLGVPDVNSDIVLELLKSYDPTSAFNDDQIDLARRVYTPSVLQKQSGLPAAFFINCANNSALRRSLADFIRTYHGRDADWADMNPVIVTGTTRAALHYFFHRPWFERVWVIQEVFRAPLTGEGQPDVLLYVGSISMDWTHFCECAGDLEPRLVTMMAATGFRPKASTTAHGLTSFADSWLSMSHHGITRRDHPHQITEILRWTGRFDASNLRDKIFAILELGSDTRGVRMEHPLIRPDYTKNLDQVMFDFVQWHFETTRSATMFNYFPAPRISGSQRGSYIDPVLIDHTWCPNLYTPNDRGGVERRDEWPFTHLAEKMGVGFLEEDKYTQKADIKEFFEQSFTFRGSTLRIAGMVLHNVTKTFHYDYPSGGGFMIGMQFYEIFSFLRLMPGSICIDGREHWPTFFQKAVRMFGVTEDEDDMNAGFIQYLIRNDWDVAPGRDDTWDAFCKKANYSPERKDLDHQCLQFEKRMMNFHKNRRLFLTRGGTPGLGPEHMEEGDVVVGLYTGRVPYVMRPWGEGYRMLGPCLMYDQQLMNHKRYAPCVHRQVELFEIL